MDEKASEFAKNCTYNWIKSVVIGFNFCPFASKIPPTKNIRYSVIKTSDKKFDLVSLNNEFDILNTNEDIETSLLIFENDYRDFNHYLSLVEKAEDFLFENGYEGVYQVASFHPFYCFEGSTEDDPANYTNRSPYPMLHLLREKSISYALDHFENPEKIPESNIDFARNKGLEVMKNALNLCMKNQNKI